MNDPNSHYLSIGMFDSGVGGLTVMKEIAKHLPYEQIIYFGDTARLPYGEKSSETICRYSIENSIFLLEQNIKMLVVACNTAAACCSGEKLRKIFNIPVLDVIEAGVEKIIQTTTEQRIAILGTKRTVSSDIYKNEILMHLPEAYVVSIACPLFVPLVEEDFLQHGATKLIIKEYLAPLKNQKIDTILLGCTHYPLLSHLIRDELGPEIAIIDSAISCAEKVSKVLTEKNLAAKDGMPLHKFFVSDDPVKFGLFAEKLLGASLRHIEKV